MRVELVAGTTNVVRFPLERRAAPTMELVRAIAPDVREVLNIADSFGLALPEGDVRQASDRMMAEHIAQNVRPEPGAERRAALEALLAPMVAGAVAACRDAADAAQAATEAQQRVVEAQSRGGYWLPPLEERAESLTVGAARLMVEAHLRSEETEGAHRAVRLALHGEAWAPFDLQAEAEALFFGGRRSA